MVDFGLERNNRRLEGIIARKANGQAEYATHVRRVLGSEYHGLPVKEVRLFDWSRTTIRRRILANILEFAL